MAHYRRGCVLAALSLYALYFVGSVLVIVRTGLDTTIRHNQITKQNMSDDT